MTEDQKINKEVAEVVMGWKDVLLDSTGLHGTSPDFGSGQTVPEYCQYVSFAFLVVNKMRSKGWFFYMRDIGNTGSCEARFSCPFGPCKEHGNTSQNWHGAEVEAKTDLFAICLAAIEAIKSPSAQYYKSLI